LAAVFILPIIWIAFYGRRVQVVVGLATLAAVLIIPILAIGGVVYPESEWRMVLVVLALLGGLLFLAKKRGMASLPLLGRRSAGVRRMEVLERVPLTPQHAIHLVRVSGKVVLIGTAPSSCTILDSALPEASPENALSTRP